MPFHGRVESAGGAAGHAVGTCGVHQRRHVLVLHPEATRGGPAAGWPRPTPPGVRDPHYPAGSIPIPREAPVGDRRRTSCADSGGPAHLHSRSTPTGRAVDRPAVLRCGPTGERLRHRREGLLVIDLTKTERRGWVRPLATPVPAGAVRELPVPAVQWLPRLSRRRYGGGLAASGRPRAWLKSSSTAALFVHRFPSLGDLLSVRSHHPGVERLQRTEDENDRGRSAPSGTSWRRPSQSRYVAQRRASF